MRTAKLSKTKIRIKTKEGKKVPYWKVISPRLGGGSIRRFFKEEEEADTYLEQQKKQIANYGIAAASMSDRLRGEALRAHELLDPLGVTLFDAAKHYAEFIKSSLAGITLSTAIELFKTSRGIKPLDKKLKGQKLPDNCPYSATYRKALTLRLKHFSEAMPAKTSRNITSGEIESFLSGRGALESQKSYRRSLRALFNFLIEEGHTEKNPVRKGKSEEVTYTVEILTPDQCARLLASCDAETLPSVAIGMFCGLRASEIERLDWSKVRLQESVIVLDAVIARKTGSRRVVPIHPTCARWLFPYAQEAGSVMPSGFRKRFDYARVKAGFLPSYSKREDEELQNLLQRAKDRGEELIPWPSNCLRHTAISYAMADCGDQSKVASWAGNSPAVIKRHYDAQASPSSAARFYAIFPEQPENLHLMAQAA